MAIVKDYRLTEFEDKEFPGIVFCKKCQYKSYFEKNHPRTINCYEIIKTKKNEENRKFRKIYENRCVYCGITTKIIDSTQFEIDHFIPKSIYKNISKPDYLTKYSEADLNSIDNLVCSCVSCNRGKSDYFCMEEKNLRILHPDKNFLSDIFIRDSDFRIVINNDYKSNEDINKLYKVLKLGNQIKRLEFFIQELIYFCNTLSDEEPIKIKINNLLRRIETKRRNYSELRD